MMKTVEDAYQAIAHSLVSRSHDGWTMILFDTKILGKNCSSMVTTEMTIGQEGQSISLGIDAAFAIDEASIFLRDDLLKTTGRRIWGLSFTLHSDGKFNIEYDYNKPDAYEKTDEVISGNEVNQAIDELNKPI